MKVGLDRQTDRQTEIKECHGVMIFIATFQNSLVLASENILSMGENGCRWIDLNQVLNIESRNNLCGISIRNNIL